MKATAYENDKKNHFYSMVHLFTVARWLPLIYSLSCLPFYLYAREVYKNKKVALCTTLGFSWIFTHNYFGSLFVTEGLPIPLSLAHAFLLCEND